MNLHDVIIDLSPEEKQIRVKKLRAQLFGLGYSVVSTTLLAKLVADARQFAKEHRP